MSAIHTFEDVIQTVLEKLVAEYAPQKVVLFGSVPARKADLDSDIDLLIVKETTERFLDRWTTVQGILTGTHRSIPVETFVLTPQEIDERLTVGDQFIQDILDKGKVLYVK